MGLIEEGTKAGLLRVKDSRIAMLAFIGMHNYTYQWIHTLDRPPTPADLSGVYCNIFLNGTSVDEQ